MKNSKPSKLRKLKKLENDDLSNEAIDHEDINREFINLKAFITQQDEESKKKIILDDIILHLTRPIIIPETLQCPKDDRLKRSTYIALGHGSVMGTEHSVDLKKTNQTFIYKNNCGLLASYFDALDIINCCRTIETENKCNDARSIVSSISNFTAGNYVKETNCSMLFDFKFELHDYCLLSGVHLVDGKIIDDIIDSVSVCHLDTATNTSYISLAQVEKIFKNSIQPTVENVLSMCHDICSQIGCDPNLIPFETFKHHFKTGRITQNYPKNLSEVSLLCRYLEPLEKNQNIIFANCRPIQEGNYLLSSTNIPRYGILQDTELVAKAKRNSDEALAKFNEETAIGYGIKKRKSIKKRKHNKKKQRSKK